MSPGNIPLLYYSKEKALTMVGAFFCYPNRDVCFGQETLSALLQNTANICLY